MPRCEDYPCCGHEPGDCPDEQGRYTCVMCTKKLPKNAHSSICEKCQRRMDRAHACGDIDHDHSMDY